MPAQVADYRKAKPLVVLVAREGALELWRGSARDGSGDAGEGREGGTTTENKSSAAEAKTAELHRDSKGKMFARWIRGFRAGFEFLRGSYEPLDSGQLKNLLVALCCVPLLAFLFYGVVISPAPSGVRSQEPDWRRVRAEDTERTEAATRLREAADERAEMLIDLQVLTPHWAKWSEEAPELVEWTLRVHNRSKTAAYKDIHFKTTYWAQSGTLIDESLIGHTEYILLPPGKTGSIKFDEIAHPQARHARIEIDSASLIP